MSEEFLDIFLCSPEVTKRVEWPPAATGSESEAEVAREENLEKEKSDKSGVDAVISLKNL